MSDPSPSGPLSHPIQASFIVVREIRFLSHRPPSSTDRFDQSSVRLSVMVTPFNEDTRLFQVTLVAEAGIEANQGSPPPLPFFIRIAITGEFSVAEGIPQDKIQSWATKAAPFVLFPYIREKLHRLTIEAGFPPLMLPLIQVPSNAPGPATAS